MRDGEFDDLGLLGGPNLGWFAQEKYDTRIKGPVITTPALMRRVPPDVGMVLADDPETAFWDLHEQLITAGFYPQRQTEVGFGSTVHWTAAIGQAGFEVHRNRRIRHGGWVRIGNRVTIGAHTCVDRSVWKEPTSIGNDTHIDNLVHIAHNVVIGDRCRIVAGTVIGGSATLEDDVFVGIGARIRPGVRIGAGAFIGMSVTVLKDVPAGARLTCQ